MLTNVRLVEARKSDSQVEHGGWRNRVNVIVGSGVVDSEQKIARRANIANQARPVAARLPSVVVSVAEEETLLVGEPVVEAIRLRVASVGARVGGHVVVLPPRIARDA